MCRCVKTDFNFQVIWFHNDKPVKESTDIQLLFEGDRCTLVIREAYLEDAGEYKVTAKNDLGFAESSCKLHVERKLFWLRNGI